MKRYTSFMIRDSEELTQRIETKPKLCVIFGHPLCKPCQKIMFMLPMLLFYSGRRGYALRFCNIKEHKKIAASVGISFTPTLGVYQSGKLQKKFEDFDEIY
ncbi:MAG: thioredoxin family protein [Candidatus Peribacteria bacterium]|nr:MAG: thioredoxin family protein [Candidatus Peribacteria bacterium]